MILLLDNYDSFSYNLYQYLGTLNPDIVVYKNDKITVDEIIKLNPSHIILSPGPGYPKDAGIMEELIAKITNIPILGVCLGHQAICEVYGLEVTNAKDIYHGKRDKIAIDNKSRLFDGLNEYEDVARYHSLIAKGKTDKLKVIAYNDDNEIMAVEHNKYPVFGVQFHPESVMTECGMKILENFLKVGK